LLALFITLGKPFALVPADKAAKNVGPKEENVN
jgi:hypothetical protein